MSTSPIVSLLAARPNEELDGLRARTQAEITKLDEQRTRLQLELAQIEEAIARQGRQRGPRGRPRRVPAETARKSSTGPTARQRVVSLLRETDVALSPSEIYSRLTDRGYAGSSSAIHNSLMKLARDGTVKRDEGMYEIASQNGAGIDATAGPTETEHHEPPSMATFAQNGG
jgi:hypothetical protein